METLARTLKQTFRALKKSPGFAAVAIVVLALGIGANTAIFSVVNAVLLRPLPFRDPGRLLQIWHTPPAKSFPGVSAFAVSAANYLDWRAQTRSFSGMAVYAYRTLDSAGFSEPESVQAAAVSGNFFAVLGSEPFLGRGFAEDEDAPGRGNVVVLSYAYWKSHFGTNRNVVGKPITLNNQPYTIVGVMGPRFRFPDWAKIWVPMAWTAGEKAVRGEHHSRVVGRLNSGVTRQQAQAELDAISSRLEEQYPEDNKGWGAVVVPLHEDLVRDVRPALLILLGAVAFVLLIACANVANLMLAKTLSRRKEIAIRSALGASRKRLLQEILVETVALSLAGGAVGLLVATGGVSLIKHFLASSLPGSIEIGLDRYVLGFTFVVSLLTGFLAGLFPALRFTGNLDVNQALKAGLGRTSSDTGGGTARNALVTCEIALALVLLIGAGLMIRSLFALKNVDPGFRADNVLTMTVSVAGNKFPEAAQQVSFFRRVLARVRSLPGVSAAAVVDDVPLAGGGSNQPVAIEGHPVVPMSEQPEVSVRVISTGYLKTMAIPLRSGRDFSDADTVTRPAVVLVSESMARQFWPNENPIGKHLTMTFFPDKVREVVGVVGDVRLEGVTEDLGLVALYTPLTQLGNSKSDFGTWHSFSMPVVVRTEGDPAVAMGTVTNAIRELDPTAPVVDAMTMSDLVSESLSQQRFNMLLLAAFAGLALLLAAVGIYSVLAFSVRRRMRDIGIRVALGAQIRDVVRLVLLEAMKPTAMGVAFGLAGSLLLARVISHFLYGIRSTDPLTFAAVSALLVMVAMLASMLPAYRASRVDPVTTLRED